jgi:transposase
MKKIAYVGIDYHMNVVTIAVIIEGEKDFYDTIRLKNSDKLIAKYMEKLAHQFTIKACYEASSSGYCFQRKMQAWGHHCDVIAPSLVPKKPGSRRKNDFRDARELAQHYANGLLTVVHPPSEPDEAARCLIRCRQSLKEAEKRVKNQINSLLLSQGLRWPKSKWTLRHRQWLASMQLPHPYLQQVLDEHLALLHYLESRVQHFDNQIEILAQSELYTDSVKKLCTLKGIRTLAAMILIAEITDFRRFASPRALMAFLGLIPAEHSSGDKQNGTAITKTGNKRCRTQLIEAVQHYVKKPIISARLKTALSAVDAATSALAVKCMNRLHKRYWALVMKGKEQKVARTAIARELAGFIWALMNQQPVPATIV